MILTIVVAGVLVALGDPTSEAFAEDGRWSAFLTDDLQVLLATYRPGAGVRTFE